MSEKRFRETAISFRITAEERQEIQAAATSLGLSPATYVRMAALKAAKGGTVSAHKAEERALRDFTEELQRIGLVTRKRSVTPVDADRVIDELRRLMILVFRFHRRDFMP
jgi:hypothetical protein